MSNKPVAKTKPPKRSALDNYNLDFSDVVENVQNPALAVINKVKPEDVGLNPEGEDITLSTVTDNTVLPTDAPSDTLPTEVPSENIEQEEENIQPADFPIPDQADLETSVPEESKPRIESVQQPVPGKEKKQKKGQKGKPYSSLEELIKTESTKPDVKYVRLNADTFALIDKVRSRYGIKIQDLVNTATYSACKQILDRK